MEIIDGKRHQEQHNSLKSSRSGSPELTDGPSSVESFRPLQRTPPPSRLGPPPSPPVPTKPVVPAAPEPTGPLMPCLVCGRTFVPESLSKHVRICEKMTVKKRKTFDSSRQRREGTDLEQYLPKNFGLPENSPFIEKSPPNTAKATPKPKPQSVRTAIMKPSADLQKCPHCGRAFGMRAFERHVEWCADKAKILPAAPAQAPPHITDAKQRLNARTQYKAPPVRTRRSSQTREKSSRSASVESSRGVSPPREFGDYKHPRSRASESGSSNDYHEESSPHVPVIRNSRSSQNKSSGDANIKARQARLARNLSSTRNNEEPIPVQTNCTINKNEKKPRLNVRKKQQLKKLEEIAERHKERSEKIIADQKRIIEKITLNSQIPKLQHKTKNNIGDTVKQGVNTERNSVAKLKPNTNDLKKKKNYLKSNKQIADKVRKEPVKESTMSLDSLEDGPPRSDKEQTMQSIGINTELLCPSVPCVIHDTSLHKTKKRSSPKIKTTPLNYTDEFADNTITETSNSVELLFKNLNMVSSCDITKHLQEQNDYDSIEHHLQLSENSIQNFNSIIPTDLYKQPNNANCKEQYNLEFEVDSITECENFNAPTQFENLSGEMYEENYERDLSEDSFECKNNKDDIKDESNLISRHGSGDTYTKFMDNPEDLEEFLTLTDNMITSEPTCQDEFSIKNIEELHTPKTSSIESICIKNSNDVPMKYNFSESIEELKNNFKNLLQETQETAEEIRNVSDLEHITVYELKFYEQETTKDPVQLDNNIKLPSITENNKMPQKSKHIAILKDKRKVMQKRTDKDYQTYIIKREESSDEAPPLKLPRIELKRLDDNYDPFACAARQMKELMSSDTNIQKTIQNTSKEPNRKLPSLKPTPTKASTLNRTDNTKTIKDTINKTYQKTPTLNRMKSFGSTNNDNLSSSFGGRCNSFRLNRNEKRPNLNTTFTKSSKENINSEKPYFNRTSNLNRSFSSYNNSVYSTPKLKNKIPKLSTSMHHAFQRNTGSQPLKLEKIKKDDKKDFVNLDAILSCDNSSMTDSNYIDPMLINENDNLPINVNTILNNPDIISSLESLLTTENLPAKFESFSTIKRNYTKNITNMKNLNNEKNNNFHTESSTTPIISDLGTQYDKVMYSLENSITSRTSGRDDDSLCEDFDLEEFMISFDDEVNKQKTEKRSCSSTTRVVKQSESSDDVFVARNETPRISKSSSNGMIPVNKSLSLVFSSNNIMGDKLLPSSVKRSTSLLDSIQKKPAKIETKNRQKTDQLEEDIMQSLKEFDKFYESQKNEKSQSNKDLNMNKHMYTDTVKRNSRKKTEQKIKCDMTNGNHTPGGKISNDSAYSSLNRVSPSKLSLCNVKESNDTVLEQIPGGSDSSDSQKEDRRSISSEEFAAMERSTELKATLMRSDIHSYNVGHVSNDANSRASTHRTSHRNSKETLSSSGSETSLNRVRREQHSAPRLSRFCHECGSKFPDKAKFCIECGVKRLLL